MKFNAVHSGKITRKVIATLLIAVALFAPLIANDKPLVASVDGRLSFPAFATYLGDMANGPMNMTWKAWWQSLDVDAEDWALMPAWTYHANEVNLDCIHQAPSIAHPFGCDDIGRDQLARVIHGAGTAVQIALGSAILAMFVGVIAGALGGITGGVIDATVQRVIELSACFPALVTVMASAAFFGGSITTIIVVLSALYWSAFARITRGEILSLRQRDFVAVARGLGISTPRLARHHILPVIKGPILVCMAFVAGNAILVESTLSFLGLDSGRVSWGAMLAQAREHSASGAWHLWLVPALVIALTIVTLHGLSDDLTTQSPSAPKPPTKA